MNSAFTYRNFEDCLAHFKANPPTGETMEIELSEQEIERLHDHAALHNCTVEAFVNAVLAWHITKEEQLDRDPLDNKEGT